MPARTHLILAFLIHLIFQSNLVAQCPPAASAPACTGTEPLVIADEIIPFGTTRWYYGSAATINSLTMRGGQLIVCSDLTVDKFYMDSGQVIINPGARFVIASGDGAGLILNGNSSIYNFGTLEIQRNLSFNGSWASASAPNIVVNATTASVFKMSNQYFVINNAHSWFVNKGRAEFWGIITDNQSSPNCVCLGDQSITTMAVLINKIPNTYTVNTGTACVYVHQYSQFFGRLTGSHGLLACLSASHTSDSGCIPFGCQPNNWGDAQLFANCNSCGTLVTLPVRFTSFEVTESRNRNILKWQLETNLSDYMLYIERSEDGQHFYTLDSLPAGLTTDFSYIDRTVPAGLNHYRVRAVELYSGRAISSKIISSVLNEQQGLRLYPSPFTRAFFVQPIAGESVVSIIVHDLTGKNIPVSYRREDREWRVELLAPLSKQMLIVRVITDGGVRVKKIMNEG